LSPEAWLIFPCLAWVWAIIGGLVIARLIWINAREFTK
jgi:hypothetical protein